MFDNLKLALFSDKIVGIAYDITLIENWCDVTKYKVQLYLVIDDGLKYNFLKYKKAIKVSSQKKIGFIIESNQAQPLSYWLGLTSQISPITDTNKQQKIKKR